ncbi:MAG: alpha/beta hydrolase [Oscillospiraceae bacterium]|nr:alpha/beta hydrolase [Oscillospiraceae bacterium]
MQHCIDSYGNVVTHDYNRIKISVSGSGQKIILLLGRKTSPSSIIELKPLIHFLEDKYTVVTMNYLGSDSSDNYHSMRTLENITSEIHEVMELLGYTNYIVISLAFAGLYSLYYANKYSDEVTAVVGIDSFVAEQRNNKRHEENVKFVQDMWLNFRHSRFIQRIVEKAASQYLKKSKSYIYSKEEIETYSNNAIYMLENMTLLDEYKCPDENFETLNHVSFHDNIPVLFILSSHRSRIIRGWYDLHKKLLRSNNSKIITLKSSKNLHLTHTEKIAKEIDEFICSLKQ